MPKDTYSFEQHLEGRNALTNKIQTKEVNRYPAESISLLM